MVASNCGEQLHLFDFLKGPFLAIQEFYMLAGAAMRNLFRRPHYSDDVFMQMDQIGVGSLFIVILTGFFSGAVLALQMARALQQYGQVGKTGQVVAITLSARSVRGSLHCSAPEEILPASPASSDR